MHEPLFNIELDHDSHSHQQSSLVQPQIILPEPEQLEIQPEPHSKIVQISEFIAADTLEGIESLESPIVRQKQIISLKDFEMMSVIGKGAYGKVNLLIQNNDR